MNKRKNLFLLVGAAIVVIVVLMLLALNRSSQTPGVTATFYPLYDFAKNIAGEKMPVYNITPEGAEAHSFEPSPSTIASALKSRVFVYNSEDFEPWVTNFIADFTGISVKASDKLHLFSTQHDHDHESGDDHTHEGSDPHFWLDPILAMQAVVNIRDGLVAADPENTDYYNKNADEYNSKLAKLDEEFRNGLAQCKNRSIVTSHDSFSYLANRYNLNIFPIAGISPEQEPSPAKLAEITNLVKEQNISYIFFETLVSPRLADTIAKETGIKTAILDPIEGISDENQAKGQDYISTQRQNLANLRIALGCE